MEGKKPKTKYIIVMHNGRYDIFPKMYDSLEEAERMRPHISRFLGTYPKELEIIKIEVTI